MEFRLITCKIWLWVSSWKCYLWYCTELIGCQQVTNSSSNPKCHFEKLESNCVERTCLRCWLIAGLHPTGRQRMCRFVSSPMSLNNASSSRRHLADTNADKASSRRWRWKWYVDKNRWSTSDAHPFLMTNWFQTAYNCRTIARYDTSQYDIE